MGRDRSRDMGEKEKSDRKGEERSKGKKRRKRKKGEDKVTFDNKKDCSVEFFLGMSL